MKRIFVALDGSPRAPQVLEAAVHLAELADAKLVLYRAITVSPDLPREVLVSNDVRLEDILRASAHGDLERIAADVPPNLIERIMTTLASPWDGICRSAAECDAPEPPATAARSAGRAAPSPTTSASVSCSSGTGASPVR